MRCRLSSSSRASARSTVEAVRSSSKGLISRASPISAAAPANSLNTSTPSPSPLQATYSLATRFIPSRSDPTQHTSASLYKATSSARSIERAELVALYKLADGCWVGWRRDGMNLIAKEYVAGTGEGDGVLER